MTKYISLEELLKVILSLHVFEYDCVPKWGFWIDKEKLIEKVFSLQTLDIGVIDEMIDKIDCYIHASKRDNISEWTLGYEMQKAVLGELKSRLLSK